MRTHYEVIGVTPSASKEDIQQAMMNCHTLNSRDAEQVKEMLLDDTNRAKYDSALFLCLPRPQSDNADLARNTFVTIMLNEGICPVPRDWGTDRNLAVCWYTLGVMESIYRAFSPITLQNAPMVLKLLDGFLSILLKVDEHITKAFYSVLERSNPTEEDDYLIGLGSTVANSHLRDSEPPKGMLMPFIARNFPE